MEWRVIKRGADMFDVLHAYGLGIVVASSTNEQVVVQDGGWCYRLSNSLSTVPPVPIDLLDKIFALPEPDEVLRVQQAQPSLLTIPLGVANLDGLLAALFTRPDVVKSCSLSALPRKHRLDPNAINRGIESVRTIYTTWKTWTAHQTPPTSHWLGELLKDYDFLSPHQPLPGMIQTEDDLTAIMALDPSLAYASRQALSDGRVARKVNMTIRGTRFSVLLAYIGAMRFLRAQIVNGGFIAYSIPVASILTLHAGSTRPLLRSRDEDEPEQALLLQALDLATEHSCGETCWTALRYQVLQAQAKQAAISRSRGVLDVARLASTKSQTRKHLLRYWKWLMRTPKRERPYEIDHLVAALVTARRQDWEAHLFDVTQAVLAQRPLENLGEQTVLLRRYSIDEVKEVSATMASPRPTPLSTILEGKEGTMRFGHALRQIKEYASSMAREVLEDLESIKTQEQLIDALTRAMQICEVMNAKTPFLIVPTDPDLKLLLEDVERYGPQTIAGLLRLLSTLRYAPRREDADHEEDVHRPLVSSEPGAQVKPAASE